MRTEIMLLSLFLLLLGGCSEMESVQVMVAESYMDDESLIHAYPSNRNSEYLSESIGLYMEYLLIVEDEKTFAEQVLLLKEHFLVQDEEFYFLRWRLNENATVNALIDDIRIISALQQAAETFGDSEYEKMASQLSLAISSLQKQDDAIVDFYDWSMDIPANRLTLSYLVDSEIIAETSAVLLEQLDASQVFFPEYYDVTSGQYIQGDEVHMIDQLLIALNREIRGFHSEVLLKWLKEQWDSEQKLYGRYDRESFKPNVEYESLAVYSYLHAYFIQVGEQRLAAEVLEHTQQLANNGILDNAHFFDFIHYELMLAKSQSSGSRIISE